MREKRTLKRIIATLLSLAMVAGIFICSAPLHVKAAEKGAYISVAFDGASWDEKLTPEENDKKGRMNRYEITADVKKKVKLKNQMTMSFVVYVPVEALEDDFSRVAIDSCVNVNDKKGGSINAKYGLTLENYYGTVVLVKEDRTSDYARSRAGSIGTVKKTKKYYVVTVTNMPLEDKVSRWDENTQSDKKTAINTKKKTSLSARVFIFGEGQKMKSKKKFYVTGITIDAAKAVTACTDDAKCVHGWWDGKQKDIKVKVGEIK